VILGFSTVSPAQVEYIARFSLEKQRSLVGEPVFCIYTIQNTGAQRFQFSYRSPSRVLNRELEQEPQFRVTDAAGRRLSDPAPRPCGGALGTVVYGFVRLAPGQSHTERWLLNQWARFSSPGHYRVRAERRLPLLAVDPLTQKVSEKPAAYALTLDELTLEVEPANEERLQAAFQPYAAVLRNRGNPDPTEAALVVTTLPQPFLLPELEAMASAPSPSPWDRKQALEGLARLGTPAAWEAILKVAEWRDFVPGVTGNSKDDPLRAYATLLLAEKGDLSFLPALLAMLSTAPKELRGDILRALGFFHDQRVYQALFEGLHSPDPADRTNAILGLKNLGTKESIPAVMAMLNDPEAQVRQVANFALESLTGQKFTLSGKASHQESAHVADQWHAWWREKGASVVPTRPPACHDW